MISRINLIKYLHTKILAVLVVSKIFLVLCLFSWLKNTSILLVHTIHSNGTFINDTSGMT